MSDASGHSGGGPTPRAQPFFCPYCGEEDIRPAEEPAGAFTCQICLRTWTLKLNSIN